MVQWYFLLSISCIVHYIKYKLEPRRNPANFDDGDAEGRQVDGDDDAHRNDERRDEQRVGKHPAWKKRRRPGTNPIKLITAVIDGFL